MEIKNHSKRFNILGTYPIMNQKWSSITILLIFLVSGTFSLDVSAGLEGTLYEETMETYSRIGDETLRWDLDREFLLRNYKEVTYVPKRSLYPASKCL